MRRLVITALAATAWLAAQTTDNFEALYRKALSLHEQRDGPRDPRSASSRLDLAFYLAEHGRATEAEPLIERAYTDLASAEVPQPERLADALEHWADIRLDQGDGAGAEALLRKALPLRTPRGAAWASVLDRLAAIHSLRGEIEQTETLQRQALLAGRTGQRLRALAITLEAKGAARDAEQLHLEALAALRQEFGDLHPQLALTLNSLGLLAVQRGDTTEAMTRLTEAASQFSRTLGPDSAELATALDNLGNLHREQGEFPRAEELLKQALAIRQKTLQPGHPDIASSLNNLGGLYHVTGRLDQAEPLYRDSIAIRQAAFGGGDATAAETAYNLGHLLRQRGDLVAAREAFRNSLAVLERAYGPDDPFVNEVRQSLAGIAPTGKSGSGVP